MFKKSILGIGAVVLAIGLCFSLAQPSYSATIVSVSFEAIGPLSDVAAFQFDVLTPDAATAADFNPNWPVGWFDFSTGDTVNAFDSTGSASLPTGIVGTFDINVTLGNWVLGNQAAETLVQGVDYLAAFDGTNYLVTAIPIPSTLILLGGGLAALVALRRRRS